MPSKPTSQIEDLIGSRRDARGLQFAHIIGVKFYEDPILAWLRPLLPDVNTDIPSDGRLRLLTVDADFLRTVWKETG